MARVTGVCDVNDQAVRQAADKYGAAGYGDWRAMLEAQPFDALFVCVPPFAHGDLEEEAAKRGIHLFVEKPLGLSMEQVEQKARAIEAAGIITATGYCLRYLETVQQAKEYLKDKRIAMITGQYLTRFVETGWWRSMEKSGGQLVEQATHTVDTMLYLGGDVDLVHAFMALRVSDGVEGLDIPDVGVVNMRFVSGAIGQMGTTFTQPDHHAGVTVMGRGFRVHVDGAKLTIVEGERTVSHDAPDTFYRDQDIAFLRAVAGGDRSAILAPYGEAAKTLAVTLAANVSARTGEVVRVSVGAR